MFYIGMDLGQRRDFTAIAVAEQWQATHVWMRPQDDRLGVRHLERVALGTPFPAVARRLEEIVGKLQGDCAVAIDATGLGAPVVDLLREARLPCEVAAVVITGGAREHQSGNVWYVPKRDLVGGLQLMLEERKLRIAKRLREVEALVRELVDMRSATLQGAAEHDDLVMAVALACWLAGRKTIGFGDRRLPGI